MVGYQTDFINALLGATPLGRTEPAWVEHLLIDSRKLVFPETTLFFAIHSAKRDGHQYIDELYRRGVRNFVVSNEVNLSAYPLAHFLYVNDVVSALQRMAASHRNHFHYPVIGITGSNAKTIIKEWLNHLLQQEFKIVRSPRSYNSQLGVPLSVWQMDSSFDLGIFEAGISQEGEMEKLEAMITPGIGLITNLGEAHSEGFVSLSDKLEEKLLLFKQSDLIIYCKDHGLIDKAIQKKISADIITKTLSWGMNASADIKVIQKDVAGGKAKITVGYKENIVTFSIPFSDPAAIENALHCFAIAVSLNKENKVLNRMEDLPPLSMRLEMKEGQNQCTLINDSYNADLNGLLSALEFMCMQGGFEKRAAILSDITGVVGNPRGIYKKIAGYLAQSKVTRLIGIGEHFIQYKSEFISLGIETEFFSTTDDFLQNFHSSNFRAAIILIKGARRFRFERISHLLEKKIHQTRLEIDLSAITYNLKAYKGKLNQGTGIMAMVKAFSYGTGSYEIANLLQFHRIEYLAVAYVDEGVDLRKAGINLPIMVMNTEQQGFPELLEYNLEPEIYSIEIAILFEQYLRNEGISFFPIHIKLDTGMHRLGFEEATLIDLIKLMSTSNAFKVQSVFTHLVASENPSEDNFTAAQINRFDQSCEKLKSCLGYSFLRHVANSAAISRLPHLQYDMVRLGIGLYGVDLGKTEMSLVESGTLRTTISQIKKVIPGDSVGYGRGAIVERVSTIATIRIGYADGFPRSLGNGKGVVWIKGHLVKTIGNICMDMTMIDITDCPEIGPNDEVVVFGKENPIKNLAQAAGTIAYEIMTGISQRVQRIYYGE